MNLTIRTTKQLLIMYYLLTLHIAALYLVADKIAEKYAVVPVERTSGEIPVEPVTANREMPASSTGQSTSAPTQTPFTATPNPTGLIIPVAGVGQKQLIDSFADSRSDGRIHDAIDIAAPAGTPVLAAGDGKIIKFFDSEAGGITIYQTSYDERFVYYYAHLERRADDIHVGDVVKQGRTIGFVGDTGNAGAGNYHLHFSIMAVSDPKRYWEGVYVNPYPLLVR